MKTFLRTISHPAVFVCIIFLFHVIQFAVVSYRPFTIAAPDRAYTIIGKNFFYPNMILQGKDGAWTVLDTHTTRPTPRVFAMQFFLVWGKIAALFSIPPIWMYLIIRVIGAMVLYGAMYWFIRLILPRAYQGVALFFALTVQTSPQWMLMMTEPLSQWVPSFETQMILERHFGLPHHTFGEACGILFLGTLYLTTKKSTPLRALLVAILAIVTTTLLPPYTVVLFLAVIPAWFLWSIFHKRWQYFLGPTILAGLSFAATGILFKQEFSKGIPWSVWTLAEKSWWTNQDIFVQYTSTLIPYIPFFLITIGCAIVLWRHWTPLFRWIFMTMSAWIIGPAILIFFSQASWFPVANGRMTDGYQYLPSGILAALGLVTLTNALKHTFWKKIVLTIVLLCSFTFSCVLTIVYTQHTFKAQEGVWETTYPRKETWKAIYFLDTVPKNSGVLVREYFGEILPAFANVRVFIGGAHGYPDYLERQWLAQQFFTGTMSQENAKALLTDNDISYVFYGPDEQVLTTQSPLYPELLITVLQTQTTTIFKVR